MSYKGMNEATRNFIKDFEQAKKEGNPLAILANSLARRFATVQLRGEDLITAAIPDDSVTINNQDLLLEPDTVTIPGGRSLAISTTTLPAETLPDDKDVIALPERQVKVWAIVHGLTCPHCEATQDMQGWQLENGNNGRLPRYVVRCGSCFHYHFVFVDSK